MRTLRQAIEEKPFTFLSYQPSGFFKAKVDSVNEEELLPLINI